MPVANWHAQIGEPTLADSILDRLVHNAHRIELNGESRRKKRVRQTADGLAVHSFSTLLEELGTRCRNTCRTKAGGSGESFHLLTELTPLQAKAFQLLGLQPEAGNLFLPFHS